MGTTGYWAITHKGSFESVDLGNLGSMAFGPLP
jgi:hypothetical protein